MFFAGTALRNIQDSSSQPCRDLPLGTGDDDLGGV